jgi:hypothetical protein
MTLPNILFIELNGLVLNNLSASPKSKKKWQSIYVKTAKAALEIISNEPIVVAVANFGNDLGNYQFFFQNLISLSRQPQILVLLEVIDEKSADTIESVHQCISVHSGENEILFEINRALTIWEQTQKKDTLAKLLPKLNKLPTPPAIYFQLRDILDSKNYSIHSLANIIARDQAISLKLLKVVNSGFYGGLFPYWGPNLSWVSS